MPNQHKRIDGDLFNKHFYHFNQPEGQFQPRLLLFNVAESKLAQDTKHYQAPFWKSRLQRLRAAKLGLTDADQTRYHSPGADDYLQLSFNGTHRDGESVVASPPEKDKAYGQSSQTVSFRLGRSRVSPNKLVHSSYLMAKDFLPEPVFPYNEQDEWQFMKEVTRDIITAQTCSERVLFHLFSQAIKRWRSKLPVPRMRRLLTKLMSDINAPKEGILSVYVQNESPTLARRKDACAVTATDRNTSDNDAHKYDQDEYEVDEDDEEIIASLADEDLEDILHGRNLDQLYRKLQDSHRMRKDQEEKKSSNETHEELFSRKAKRKDIEEGSSIKSESIKSAVENTPEATRSSARSNVSSKSGTPSVAQSASSVSISRSSKERSDHHNGRGAEEIAANHADSDTETAVEVSDIEEDQPQKQANAPSSGIATEKTTSVASRKSSVVDIKQGTSPKAASANESVTSSISSGEIRLNATPPEALQSDDSNLPSARKNYNKVPLNLPSRELSLKSENSSSQEMPMSRTKRSHKKWIPNREQSITNLESPPPPLDSHELNESIVTAANFAANQNLMEEVRQKRESFLKRLQENDKMNSNNGSGNEKSHDAFIHAPAKSISRQSPVNGNGKGDVELTKESENAVVRQASHEMVSKEQRQDKHMERESNDFGADAQEIPTSPTLHMNTESQIVHIPPGNAEIAENDQQAAIETSKSSSPVPPKARPRASLTRQSLGMILPAGLVQPGHAANHAGTRQNSEHPGSRRNSSERYSTDLIKDEEKSKTASKVEELKNDRTEESEDAFSQNGLNKHSYASEIISIQQSHPPEQQSNEHKLHTETEVELTESGSTNIESTALHKDNDLEPFLMEPRVSSASNARYNYMEIADYEDVEHEVDDSAQRPKPSESEDLPLPDSGRRLSGDSGDF